eukprot:1195982-Prorocentrum_minimum.AAC.3
MRPSRPNAARGGWSGGWSGGGEGLAVDRRRHCTTVCTTDCTTVSLTVPVQGLEAERAVDHVFRRVDRLHRCTTDCTTDCTAVPPVPQGLEAERAVGEAAQLRSAVEALQAEVAFREGQCTQAVEDAAQLVQQAEAGVAARDKEVARLKDTTHSLSWAKGLLSGQVSSLRPDYSLIQSTQ